MMKLISMIIIWGVWLYAIIFRTQEITEPIANTFILIVWFIVASIVTYKFYKK